ncbi:MAG TPA: metallophosphoesterase family protein [Pirellulales bacterium]
MNILQNRLIAIGDVHGCVHALDALLEAIVPAPQDQLVFLGDLIDQGHDSCQVLDRLIALKQQCQVILIRGNHEEMLFASRDSEPALRYWENCGGVTTLNSYRFGGGLDAIPARHWGFLEECRPYFETDEFIFTHAHYLPDLPMSAQPDHQLRWALFDPAEMRPHYSGKPVIVGHTEQADCEINDLGFAVCIDTACWQHGWLTALELHTKQLWQASRWGLLRDQDEPTHRGRLPQLVRAERE